MPISKPNNLLPSIKNISQSLNGHSSHNFKKPQAQIPNHLHQQAFDNSLQPNIISVVSNGKILAVNHAAGKLLGYSGKELLSKKFDELFTPSDAHFKQVLKQRGAVGHTSGDLTVIKKMGSNCLVRLLQLYLPVIIISRRPLQLLWTGAKIFAVNLPL